ncbi:MAG TPA: HlyD family secretion protein [Phycisphaerae bacterium]|nr:HlyD family secretion protein [Phycisphaerae bacterium]
MTDERASPSRPAPRNEATEKHAAQDTASEGTAAKSVSPVPSRGGGRRWLWIVGLGVPALAAVLLFGIPRVLLALTTVSTDDAYVNGHVTFVAARVPGQVSEVLVDDNDRVKKGDVLVRLDPVPYQVQVAIKKAAVETAETNLATAQAQVTVDVAQARANRFKLQHAIEDVDNQIANLRAALATLDSKKAALELAKANLKRGEVVERRAISEEDLDLRRETVKVDEAAVEQALEQVYAIRASLGLPTEPPAGKDLADVPPDLDENFSAVRQALADLMQGVARIGYYPTSWDATPKQAIAAFIKQDPEGNLDRIFAHLITQAPDIKQAQAKLTEARRDLEQAELNLSYCNIVSEIDGVVTGRDVNPGNNVQVGQGLMAVRSLREIWIDANFKETQLADLRIGQRARCEVDMYGNRREFEGRITGFTMGTGETLSLLPPQNATGNFVKIVQRLPVRIELTHYDPDKDPLFVGLSVIPYVYYKEPPTGTGAGDFLKPLASLPQATTEPQP